MYTEASLPRRNGDETILLSPAYNATAGSACYVSFWYNMYGSYIGDLELGTDNEPLLWCRQGQQSNQRQWIRGQFSFSTESFQTFKVRATYARDSSVLR